jgi:hypothetical protein
MKKIFKELFELFVKSNKREPNAIEMLQLKFKASQKASQQVGKGEVIPFPPERITDWTKARPQPPEIEIIDGVQTTRGLGDLFERQMKNIGKKDPALYEDRGGNIIPAQFDESPAFPSYTAKDSLPPGGTRESVRKEAIEKYGIQPETDDQIIARLNNQNKEGIERLKNKSLDPDDALPNYTETPGEYSRRNTPGSIENLREEIKIAYRNEFDRLTGNETAGELKEILKNLDTDGVPFSEGGPADFENWKKGKDEFEKEQSKEELYREYLEQMRRKKIYDTRENVAEGGRPTSTGLNYLLGEDDTNSRVSYGAGGRRGFLKLLAGLGAAGAAFKTGLLGLTKGGGKKVATEVAKEAATGGAPPHFFKLVAKIKALGDDVTEVLAYKDRQKVTKYKDFELTEDLTTGRQEIQRYKVLDDESRCKLIIMVTL